MITHNNSVKRDWLTAGFARFRQQVNSNSKDFPLCKRLVAELKGQTADLQTAS